MKKVLILGASGMAGHLLYTYLTEQHSYIVIPVCHSENKHIKGYVLDVYNLDELKNILVKEQPDIVVNCIGILISGSRKSLKNAIYVNAYFPHALADICDAVLPSSRVIHISTDCVFSGSKGLYTDTDTKDALDVYGMSKNLGELINTKHITLRTSIIGPELKQNGVGLLHWFLSKRKEESVTGYTASVWGGITTLELAKCIHYFLENEYSGLYQVSNNVPISKYDLLCLFKKYFKTPVNIEKTEGVKSNKSILSSVKEGIDITIPSYENMIHNICEFMIQHKEMYKAYFN